MLASKTDGTKLKGKRFDPSIAVSKTRTGLSHSHTMDDQLKGKEKFHYCQRKVKSITEKEREEG